MADVSNSDDLIDSRDVIARIEELESSVLPWRAKLCDYAGIDQEDLFATHEEARDALAEWLCDYAGNHASAAEKDACEATASEIENLSDGALWDGGVGSTSLVATIEAAEVDADEAAELVTLHAVASEAEDYAPDWNHGATMIRETYFTEYCEDLVRDIGALPREIPPYIAIDWEKTADNLRVDYTEIEFGGVTYLIR